VFHIILISLHSCTHTNQCIFVFFLLFDLAFAMCFQADGVQQKSEGSPSPPAVSSSLQAGNGAKENGLKENSPTPVPSLGEGPRDSQGLDKRIPGTSKCKIDRFSPYMIPYGQTWKYILNCGYKNCLPFNSWVWIWIDLATPHRNLNWNFIWNDRTKNLLNYISRTSQEMHSYIQMKTS